MRSIEPDVVFETGFRPAWWRISPKHRVTWAPPGESGNPVCANPCRPASDSVITTIPFPCLSPTLDTMPTHQRWDPHQGRQRRQQQRTAHAPTPLAWPAHHPAAPCSLQHGAQPSARGVKQLTGVQPQLQPLARLHLLGTGPEPGIPQEAGIVQHWSRRARGWRWGRGELRASHRRQQDEQEPDARSKSHGRRPSVT